MWKTYYVAAGDNKNSAYVCLINQRLKMNRAQRQLVFLLYLRTFKKYIKKHKKGIKKAESLVETSRGKESWPS